MIGSSRCQHPRSIVGSLVASVLFLALGVSAGLGAMTLPASAGDGDGSSVHVDTGPGGTSGVVQAQTTQTSSQPGQQSPGSVIPQGPYEVTQHVEACNVANNGTPGTLGNAVQTIVGCIMDAEVCTPSETFMWDDTATFENGQQQTDWIRDGGGCVAPGTGVGPVITVQAVMDAARVQAPPSIPHVEPGNRSYVNLPNNYWTATATTTKAVNVLGIPIVVTFVPQTTSWDFGDGATAEGNGIKGASIGQEGAVEHAYERQGSYDISTSTTYRVTFAIPGAAPQTLTLTSTPSAPVTLPIGEIQTRVDATG